MWQKMQGSCEEGVVREHTWEVGGVGGVGPQPGLLLRMFRKQTHIVADLRSHVSDVRGASKSCGKGMAMKL